MSKPDIVEQLLDPDFRGPMQHLRDWREIDRLHSDAAAQIASLRTELQEARNKALEEVASFVEVQRNDIPANGWEFAAAIRELKGEQPIDGLREKQIVAIAKALEDCTWFQPPISEVETKSAVWATRLWDAAKKAGGAL